MTERRFTELYLITPPKLNELLEFSEQLKAALDAGGVKCVQLRLKDIVDIVGVYRRFIAIKP